MIEGGKQDRTIAIDVAIAPGSAPQPITAFCVEHGRWTAKSGSAMAFSSNTAISGTVTESHQALLSRVPSDRADSGRRRRLRGFMETQATQ